MLTTRWPQAPRRKDWSSSVRVRGAELRLAWVDFLGRLPWDFFVTLTFDPSRVFPVGRVRAGREAFRWCTCVAWTLRQDIAWLIALERGKSGQWHAHALLAGVTADIAPLADVWRMRNGRIDVQSVRESIGVVLYSTKQAALSGEIVLSDSLVSYRNRVSDRSRVFLHPQSSIRSGADDAE